MEKGKRVGKNIIIVMLIILLIASVCAGLYAWSKYTTTVEGTATSQTAKWNFKLKGNSTYPNIPPYTVTVCESPSLSFSVFVTDKSHKLKLILDSLPSSFGILTTNKSLPE